MSNRKGSENLIPFSERTEEDQRRIRQKGGKASGAARRAKRDAKAVAQMVLSSIPDLPPNTLEAMCRMGMSRKIKPDVRIVSMYAVANQALKGDVKALDYLLSLAGETPSSELDHIKAEEARFRAGHEEDNDHCADNTDIESVRRKMSTMTDEQLASYEQLCGMFAADEVEIEGGFVDE